MLGQDVLKARPGHRLGPRVEEQFGSAAGRAHLQPCLHRGSRLLPERQDALATPFAHDVHAGCGLAVDLIEPETDQLGHTHTSSEGQDRRRLQVPVSVRHVSVAEVGAECHDMPSNRSAIVVALFQRTDREGVTQIVDARVTPGVCAPEMGTIEELQEDPSHGVVGQRSADNRYEECTIRSGERPAGDQISIEGLPCRRVQRQEPALLELGLSDDEPVHGLVVELQCQCLRDPHAGSGEQAEQRCVHGRSDRACWLECRGSAKQSCDLVYTIDIRQAPLGDGVTERIR